MTRLERAKWIADNLAEQHHSTVAQDAAKQLRVIIRGAERQIALGKPELAEKVLEWAA